MLMTLLLACTGQEPVKDSEAPDDSGEDTGSPIQPIWDWCPDSSSYVGDEAWTGQLSVTEGALFCSSANEGRTLPQEKGAKSRLRLIPGDYRLPTVQGHHDIGFAACIEQGSAGPALSGPGATDVSPSSFAGTTYTYLNGAQPMIQGDEDWTLDHTVVLAGPEGQNPAPLTIDGKENDALSGTGASFVLHKVGTEAYALEAMAYAPCMDPTWDENIHSIQFEGGEVEIHLYLGLNGLILTGPSAFTQATGTLDGTSFDINSFYQLIYRPGHHHFDRHFALIFDAPIGAACALLLEDLDYQEGTTTATVHTADCDLTALEARNVTSEDIEIR